MGISDELANRVSMVGARQMDRVILEFMERVGAEFEDLELQTYLSKPGWQFIAVRGVPAVGLKLEAVGPKLGASMVGTCTVDIKTTYGYVTPYNWSRFR